MGLISAAPRGAGPSCVLLLTATLDIHLVGAHPFLWNRVVDNEWDFNTLGALPSGLGLSCPLNGIDGTITTTTAGIWQFTLLGVGSDGADAGIRGFVSEGFGGANEPFGPIQANGALGSVTTAYALPSGAGATFRATTEVIATGNPYRITPNLSIVRLA